MVLPAVRLHQMYSITFNNSVDVALHDIRLVDINALDTYLHSKQDKDIIHIVPHKLYVNVRTKELCIVGHLLKKGKWIVCESDSGSSNIIPLTISDKDLHTTLEYLYHVYNNIVLPQIKN
jgi:hypothetical protein